jgi:hypothetical protein
VSTATDMETGFLGNVPTEIRDVLDWFNVERARGVPSQHLREFAGRFLAAMHDDGAVRVTCKRLKIRRGSPLVGVRPPHKR